MANTEQYGSGTTPRKGDTERMLMVKQLIATVTGGGGVLYGAVDPVSPPASAAAVYINTVTERIWWYYNGQWN